MGYIAVFPSNYGIDSHLKKRESKFIFEFKDSSSKLYEV